MNEETTTNNLPQHPEYIPGIYNYCDRGCERCPFTRRCRNYVDCEERFGDEASIDVKNAEFWDDLQDVFQDAIQILEEAAEEVRIVGPVAHFGQPSVDVDSERPVDLLDRRADAALDDEVSPVHDLGSASGGVVVERR